MEFWHKKPFSIRFVHKSRKLSNFEPTFNYIMLRNLRTVRPIFPKIAPKVAQDFKEKSHESLRRGKKFPQNYRAKRRGGADSAPPVLLEKIIRTFFILLIITSKYTFMYNELSFERQYFVLYDGPLTLNMSKTVLNPFCDETHYMLPCTLCGCGRC